MPLLLLLLLASRLLPRARVARRAAIAVAAFAAAAAAGCALGRAQPDAPLTPVRVTRVVDGDTIEVQTGGRRERVRLLGIDTPELRRPAGAECGAAAARANLRRLTRPGRGGARVRLHTDPDSGDVRDRYGRLLAYADGPHGDLGEAQLRAGLARRVPPPRPDLLAPGALPARGGRSARPPTRHLVRLPKDRAHDEPLTSRPDTGTRSQAHGRPGHSARRPALRAPTAPPRARGPRPIPLTDRRRSRCDNPRSRQLASVAATATTGGNQPLELPGWRAAPFDLRDSSGRADAERSARETDAGRQLQRCFPRWSRAFEHLRRTALSAARRQPTRRPQRRRQLAQRRRARPGGAAPPRRRTGAALGVCRRARSAR